MRIDFRAIIAQPDPPAFQEGDMITFEKSDGRQWIVVLLEPSLVPDAWECLWWDGRPHQATLAESLLAGLRIVKRERCSEDQISMWEGMLEAAA